MPIDVGPLEALILVAVVALVFGPKELPGLARRMGKAMRELKGALGDVDPRSMLEAEEERSAGSRQAPENDRSMSDLVGPRRRQ
jgi:sec-independent protein translocase protein TatA